MAFKIIQINKSVFAANDEVAKQVREQLMKIGRAHV